MINDLAQRFAENPILRPADIQPSAEGMEVTCLLNPGVFRFQDQTWLLVRVAERPVQVPGKTSFPILSPEGRLEVLEFNSGDSRLDLSDPGRIISPHSLICACWQATMASPSASPREAGRSWGPARWKLTA
jgi:hypothetical protein